MAHETPYNPLDKKNLGISVADALLERSPDPLAHDELFIGAGIYAIYYVGANPAYARIAEQNKDGRFTAPIYVGKAVPAGARKGGALLGASETKALFNRLREHAESISQVKSLSLADFFCRHLIVDDIWIPLGESLLIEMFEPVWNKVIDGFGNHDPGKGRTKQQRSAWDVIHPGRPWAKKLRPNNKTRDQLLDNLSRFVEHRQAEIIEPPYVDQGE